MGVRQPRRAISIHERPSKEARLTSIPSPQSLVAHLDQLVIGQHVAERRLALGVSNHFKRLVDSWDRDDPDPIIADADLHNVRIEKSNIFLIGPSGSGKTLGGVFERPTRLRRAAVFKNAVGVSRVHARIQAEAVEMQKQLSGEFWRGGNPSQGHGVSVRARSGSPSGRSPEDCRSTRPERYGRLYQQQM